MEENGNVRELPSVVIGWDAQKQAVHLGWAPEFTNYEFILGLLEMARLNVDKQKRMAELQALQQAAADQQVLRQLRRG